MHQLLLWPRFKVHYTIYNYTEAQVLIRKCVARFTGECNITLTINVFHFEVCASYI